MSAHITAELGRLYLMDDGQRCRVEAVSARYVTFSNENYVLATQGRIYFERSIESVLE